MNFEQSPFRERFPAAFVIRYSLFDIRYFRHEHQEIWATPGTPATACWWRIRRHRGKFLCQETKNFTRKGLRGDDMHRLWSTLAFALVTATLVSASVAWAAQPPDLGVKLYEMEVLGVQSDPASGTPLVFLRGKQDRRELSMFIGPFEAQGILLPLQRMRPPRPYTHDLMLETIHRLKATVRRVVITEIRDNTYFANLVLDVQGQELILDSRPSDAIALALRENVPILAAEAAFRRPPRDGQPRGGERDRP
jgi:bifunctional DNase/RNase